MSVLEVSIKHSNHRGTGVWAVAVDIGFSEDDDFSTEHYVRAITAALQEFRGVDSCASIETVSVRRIANNVIVASAPRVT